MKNSAYFRLVVTTILIVGTLACSASAQNGSLNIYTTQKNALATLVSGIKSDNPGLRRSAIYYAGKYNVIETVDILTELLDEEKSPEMRRLIALTLYKIGNEHGMKTVKKLSLKDPNEKVRRISAAIYDTYLFETAQNTNQDKEYVQMEKTNN